MNRILITLFSAILLAGCGLISGQQSAAPPTLDPAAMTRVAEAVAATAAARSQQTASAPTPKPTNNYLDLDEAALNAEQLNIILGVWPMTPEQSIIPSSHPYCLLTCSETLWYTLDGKGTLQIDMFEFPNRDRVVDELREIQNTQQVLNLTRFEIPEEVSLPTESWIQDNGSTGSRYTLHTRQGKALIILTLYLPEYPESQNILFLALYAQRQVEVLAAAGW